MGELLLDREHRLHRIGRALSTEKNPDALLEMILEGAKELTGADGGTIYLVTPEEKLRFSIVRTESLGLYYGGETGEKMGPFEDLPYKQLADSAIVCNVAATLQTLNVTDLYTEKKKMYQTVFEFDKKMNYHTYAILAVPIIDHEKRLKAVIQLINPLQGGGFSEQDEELVESFASQAGVALSNLQFIEDFKSLFAAFSASIGEAIDAKSPVTGRHEKRVPILTVMLAERWGEFTRDQLYEMKIAALLHDCGKLTTPDYLLEKVNKLEGPYNRMELIDQRIALKKKEKEIAYLKKEITETQLEEQIALLGEQQEFLHFCNSAPLSPLQKTKLAGIKAQGIITHEEWEHLSVSEGNLTNKERQIMQEHVVVTYKMLAQLPFPPSLRQVADIAASHHEKLNGKGYPRGLKGNQISLPARILAIADVFEALSAPDRPYKKPLTLSQVINKMTQMAEEGHLDKQLVHFFIESKVFLLYAQEYLMPDQIDIT